MIDPSTATFNCPECNSPLKSSSADANEESYLVANCTSCKYEVSPSHSAAHEILRYERFNNIPHEWFLKTWPIYYAAIESGVKTFEFRETKGRDFQVGDILYFELYDPEDQKYEGVSVTKGTLPPKVITFVLVAEDINFSDRRYEEFVIFSFKNLEVMD